MLLEGAKGSEAIAFQDAVNREHLVRLNKAFWRGVILAAFLHVSFRFVIALADSVEDKPKKKPCGCGDNHDDMIVIHGGELPAPNKKEIEKQIINLNASSLLDANFSRSNQILRNQMSESELKTMSDYYQVRIGEYSGELTDEQVVKEFNKVNNKYGLIKEKVQAKSTSKTA